MKRFTKSAVLFTAFVVSMVFAGCSDSADSGIDAATSLSSSSSAINASVWKQTDGSYTAYFDPVNQKAYINNCFFNYKEIDSYTLAIELPDEPQNAHKFIIDSSNPNTATFHALTGDLTYTKTSSSRKDFGTAWYGASNKATIVFDPAKNDVHIHFGNKIAKGSEPPKYKEKNSRTFTIIQDSNFIKDFVIDSSNPNTATYNGITYTKRLY